MSVIYLFICSFFYKRELLFYFGLVLLWKNLTSINKGNSYRVSVPTGKNEYSIEHDIPKNVNEVSVHTSRGFRIAEKYLDTDGESANG